MLSLAKLSKGGGRQVRFVGNCRLTPQMQSRCTSRTYFYYGDEDDDDENSDDDDDENDDVHHVDHGED